MFCVAIFGGNKVDGSMLEPAERVVSLALFGGLELDLASVPPPPALEVIVVAIFGGATIKVRPDEQVTLSGVSLFGGRSIEPRRGLSRASDARPAAGPCEDEGILPPLEITAYSLFGGVSVKRQEQ